MLAKCRCHYIVLKVVAGGAETQRKTLYGHTIIFPQEPSTDNCGGFNAAVLQAALGQVRIQFVGPSGERSKLERTALQLDDLRLRPELIYNFLQLRAVVTGSGPPPPIEEIAALIKPADGPSAVEAHVRATAEMASVGAAGAERAVAGSDVAGVRANAQCDAHRQAAGEEDEEDGEGEGRLLMQTAGVLSIADQEMEAVIEGIAAAVADAQEDGEVGEGGDGEGGDRDGRDGDRLPQLVAAGDGEATTEAADAPEEAADAPEEATDAPAVAAVAEAAGNTPLQLRRGGEPSNDYEGAAAAILDGWWSLFPLARGVAPKPFERPALRALFLYYDNRFAHDLALLFHCANTKMRHDVNRAVGARVKSNGEAFAKFTELVADASFLEQLEEARKNPKGAVARQVLKRVIGFINLAAKNVPWGTRERAAAMTMLIADHRNEGAGSIFYSVSPDDTHSMMAIRYALAFVDYESFPCAVDEEAVQALRGQTAQERTTANHKMGEAELQVSRHRPATPPSLPLPSPSPRFLPLCRCPQHTHQPALVLPARLITRPASFRRWPRKTRSPRRSWSTTSSRTFAPTCSASRLTGRRTTSSTMLGVSRVSSASTLVAVTSRSATSARRCTSTVRRTEGCAALPPLHHAPAMPLPPCRSRPSAPLIRVVRPCAGDASAQERRRARAAAARRSLRRTRLAVARRAPARVPCGVLGAEGALRRRPARRGLGGTEDRALAAAQASCERGRRCARRLAARAGRIRVVHPGRLVARV